MNLFMNTARMSAVLVRPDGFVAWAGEAAPNHEEASQAASRWFGEPEEVREPTPQWCPWAAPPSGPWVLLSIGVGMGPPYRHPTDWMPITPKTGVLIPCRNTT